MEVIGRVFLGLFLIEGKFLFSFSLLLTFRKKWKKKSMKHIIYVCVLGGGGNFFLGFGAF